MSAIRVFLSRVVGLFRRRDAQLDQEIEMHLDLLADEHLRRGMSREQASAAARRAFGGVPQTKEAYRDRRSLRLVEDFLQDLRFGLRYLVKSPGFAFTAIATLTIGIGVNVLIFSFAFPILTTRLPGVDPRQLVRIYESGTSNVFYADYEAFRDRTRVLDGVSASQVEGVSLRVGDLPDHVTGMVVSGNYFQVLGVGAQHGRTLVPTDDQPGAAGAVVVSDRSWRVRFGRDPGTVGRSIVLNGHSFAIVGIAPAEFIGTALPAIPELWVAWHAPGFSPSAEDAARRRGRSAQVIGRLAAGYTVQDAQKELAAIAADLAARYPENRGRTVNVYEGHLVAPALRTQALGFLSILLTLTALVLGVACVNLAGLQLARGAARHREIGVRLALGAGRGRLVRQLLTESLFLSSLSAGAAVASAVAGARLLSSWSAVLPGGQTLTVETSIGWDAMAFATALAVLTTILVGLLPALRASRPDIVSTLHSAPSAGGRLRGQSALVAAQLSLTTILLVLAAVLARSLVEARQIDPGFSSEGVLSVSIDVSSRSYSQEQGARFLEGLRERVQNVPGVMSVGLAELVPVTMSGRSRLALKENQPFPADADRGSVAVFTNNISPGFLATIDIPVLAGRDFDGRDTTGRSDVAVINETMARRYWPDADPIGRRFHLWDGLDRIGPGIEVIGVARDSKYVSLGEERRSFFYRPLAQSLAPDVTILIKSAAEPLALLPTLRSELRAFDPGLALIGAAALEEQTEISLMPVQLAGTVAMALGLVVLTLAAIGTYGVTTYELRRRTREVAIRIALGAEPRRVVTSLIQGSMRWAALAVGCGLAAAGVATSVLSALLYGVSAVDPIAFGAVACLMGATAYFAAWWPARRAARIDPMVALRSE